MTVRNAASLLTLLVTLGLTGCSSHERHESPDEQLRELVEEWERAKRGDVPLVKETEVPDPELVRHRFQRLAVVYPGHVPTLVANAVVAYDAKHPDQAQQYLDRALSLQPACPEAVVLRSRLAVEDGNLNLARKLLDDQVRLRPDHFGVREAQGGVLYALGRYDEARVAVDWAARLGAPEWRTSYDLGLIEEAQGNLEAAARLYETSVRGNPSSPATHRLRALEAGAPRGR